MPRPRDSRGRFLPREPPAEGLAEKPEERSEGSQNPEKGKDGASAGQTAISTAGLFRRQFDEISIEDESDDEDDLDWSLLQIDLSKKLDKSILKAPHAKLGILKALNYQTWAQDHKRFFEGRGIFCIVSGDLTKPRHDRTQAKRWMILNQWIATLIADHMEETQKSHIAHLRTAKAIWDAFSRVHGASEKGRLSAMLQKLHGYTKSINQSIDQMAADLRKLRGEIANLEPQAAPPDVSMATVLMSACKGREYETAKYVLSMTDSLTMDLAVEYLRGVEQDNQVREDLVLVARSGRKDKSHIECYTCGKYGHYQRRCPEKKS